jgi:4-amino-4-deoxy-L-arabinose transferase-like glycosyltransferase
MKDSKESKKRDHLLILLILLAAFILYYCSAALPQPSNDDIYYMGTAYYASIGKVLEFDAFPFSAAYGIVLPLALLYKLFGFNMFLGIYYNIALSLVAIALVYKIAQQYSKHGGVIAAFIFAFMPATIGASNIITPDMFVLVMALLSLLAFHSAKRHSNVALYYTLSGLFAFMSTFGNAVGYMFLLVLFVYALLESLKQHSGKILGFASLGIIIGFVLGMAISWYMSNGLYLSKGLVKYPYLFSTYYLYLFYLHTSGNPPSPFNISPITLIYGILLLPTKYISSNIVTQSKWPYAYGILLYLFLFTILYAAKKKMIGKYRYMLSLASSIFIMQLIVMLAVVSRQGFFEYFRFELLITAPLAIFVGSVLSDYAFARSGRRRAATRARHSRWRTRLTVVVLILILVVVADFYFSYLYSIKNAYTTNMLYGTISGLSMNLTHIVGSNSTIYTPYDLPPFVSGRLDIMFYSSMYGLNPDRFALLSNDCFSVPAGSYIIYSGNATVLDTFSRACNAQLLYNTKETILMPYSYGVFETNT